MSRIESFEAVKNAEPVTNNLRAELQVKTGDKEHITAIAIEQQKGAKQGEIEFNTNSLYKSSDHKAASAPNDFALKPTPENVPENYKAEIKQDVKPGVHAVQPNDSLYSIAAKHLGKDASPSDVMKHMYEIAAANGMKDVNHVIHPGDVLKMPGHTKDGGHVTHDHMGNRTTAYKDGTTVKENIDGSGSIKHADGTEQKWGRNEKPLTNEKPGEKPSQTPEDKGLVTTDKDGNKTTKYNDGTVKQENKDGTGFVKHPDGAEEHWGKKPEDNYKITKDGDKISKQADGSTVTEGKDGSKKTEYPDGAVRVENKDGTGYARDKDGNEKHWGPNARDNYETAAGGGKVEWVNGTKVTTWPDGSYKHENWDGTGFAKHKDGSEEHWGKKPEDNYKITKDGDKISKTQDGGTCTEDKNGNKKTEYPGGEVRVENKDGTGYARDKNGNEKHWGPKADDNYETAVGGGKVTHQNGDKVTTWPNGVIKVESPDGTGCQMNKDGSGKHWGPKPEDNYEVDAKGGVHRQVAGGGERLEQKDGSAVTKYPDGTVKRENPDGSGFVKKTDGSEQHWGPNAADNYSIAHRKDGGVERTDAHNNKTTVWKDGTIMEQRADGTGYVKKPDGSSKHWGPKPQDNYETAAAA